MATDQKMEYVPIDIKPAVIDEKQIPVSYTHLDVYKRQIEYTADVVWGLQLQILNDELFNNEKKIKEKREKVRQAKKAIPREIELVCLKNRYGVSSYSCGFKYDPRFDLFEPDNLYKVAEDFDIPTGNGKRK